MAENLIAPPSAPLFDAEKRLGLASTITTPNGKQSECKAFDNMLKNMKSLRETKAKKQRLVAKAAKA